MGWTPDWLGSGFQERNQAMGDFDREGPIVGKGSRGIGPGSQIGGGSYIGGGSTSIEIIF